MSTRLAKLLTGEPCRVAAQTAAASRLPSPTTRQRPRPRSSAHERFARDVRATSPPDQAPRRRVQLRPDQRRSSQPTLPASRGQPYTTLFDDPIRRAQHRWQRAPRKRAHAVTQREPGPVSYASLPRPNLRYRCPVSHPPATIRAPQQPELNPAAGTPAPPNPITASSTTTQPKHPAGEQVNARDHSQP
jgi:hypothetical protein